jgi:hypothetical protein
MHALSSLMEMEKYVWHELAVELGLIILNHVAETGQGSSGQGITLDIGVYSSSVYSSSDRHHGFHSSRLHKGYPYFTEHEFDNYAEYLGHYRQ